MFSNFKIFSSIKRDLIYKLYLLEDSTFLRRKYKEYIEHFKKYSIDNEGSNNELGDILKDFALRNMQVSYREFIARIFDIYDTTASEALYKYDDESLALYLFTTQKFNNYILFQDYKDYLKDIHIKNEELKLIYGDEVIDDSLLKEIAWKESEDNYDIGYLWTDFQLTKGKTIKEFLDKNGYLKIKEVNELKDILDDLISSK